MKTSSNLDISDKELKENFGIDFAIKESKEDTVGVSPEANIGFGFIIDENVDFGQDSLDDILQNFRSKDISFLYVGTPELGRTIVFLKNSQTRTSLIEREIDRSIFTINIKEIAKIEKVYNALQAKLKNGCVPFPRWYLWPTEE